MKPTPFSVNRLTGIDNDDKMIKSLLGPLGISREDQAKKHILVAKNQQQTKALGILIAEKTQQQTLKITYIYVKPIWRRLSIGSALIHQLEQACKSEGVTTITVTFDRQNHAMNGLTQSQQGWSDGEPLNSYTFSSRLAMEPILQQLEQKRRHHTRRLDIRPLSECDEQNIIQASNAEHVPTWARLNTINLRKAVHNLSIVLHHNDRIIGWLITFPLLDEMLDYRILWIDSAHRKTGLAITALSEIIRKAHFQDNLAAATISNDMGNPWPRGFFIMHSKNQAMINFVNRRLAQGINQQSELIYREKNTGRQEQQRENEPTQLEPN